MPKNPSGARLVASIISTSKIQEYDETNTIVISARISPRKTIPRLLRMMRTIQSVMTTRRPS